MAEDKELQAHLQDLTSRGQAALTRDEKMQRQRSLESLGLPSFYNVVKVGQSSDWVHMGAALVHACRSAPCPCMPFVCSTESPGSDRHSTAASLALQRAWSLTATSPLPPLFYPAQERAGVALVRSQARILQLNIGLYCNQACNHCHVESSPKRKEMMDR